MQTIDVLMGWFAAIGQVFVDALWLTRIIVVAEKGGTLTMADKEYIEREALLKELELLAKYEYGERRQGILGVCATIRNKSTADVVEVRHGEWRYEGNYKACSLCGTFVEWNTLGTSHWKYCPYCGAKMDGKGENA